VVLENSVARYCLAAFTVIVGGIIGGLDWIKLH
jgi:hypothetical protein